MFIQLSWFLLGLLLLLFFVFEAVLYFSRVRTEMQSYDKEWREIDTKWRDVVSAACVADNISTRDFIYTRLCIDYAFSPNDSLESEVTVLITPLKPLEEGAYLSWFIPRMQGWEDVGDQWAEVDGIDVLPQVTKASDYTVLRVPIGSRTPSKRKRKVTFGFVVNKWAVTSTPVLFRPFCRKQNGYWRHHGIHQTDHFEVRFKFPENATVRSAFCTASDFRQTTLEGRASYVLKETPFKGSPCGGVFTYLGSYSFFLWFFGILFAVAMSLTVAFCELPDLRNVLLIVVVLAFLHWGLAFWAKVYPRGT